jgi:phage terminase small subunit
MGRTAKAAKEAGLTDQQERFCREYALELNATKAAVAAGYSERTAQQQGSDILSRPLIAARVAELQAASLARLDCKLDDVIRELTAIGLCKPTDVFTVNERGVTPRDLNALPPHVQAAVAEVSQTISAEGGSIRIKLHDKVAALDKLMRRFGAYKDSLDLKTPWDKQFEEMTDEQLLAHADALRAAREKG